MTLAPYLLYIFNKNFDIDLFFGGTFTENDNERMVGGTVVTSDSDSWTTFISAHANYTRWMGRWKFTGNSGVTPVELDLPPFTVPVVSVRPTPMDIPAIRFR